ncbi:diphthine--ammonia ligase [Skeletonema marinoi]|uniref:Diphthine--ammonia ligase n=2 Tax=Skeletonema marinoi TaxID=267567 RepID=A0AAD8Y9S5_9STRA|nr:diphthine--ammonia ligase [Skeletonema marinoi]
MKFVALLSGGKDSIYSTLKAIQNGHELVCCAHLAPMQENTEEESYMYQTAGSEVVKTQVEECIGVPFYMREIHGQSKIKSLVYENDGDGSDEVEDLYILLEQIQANHPEVEGVSSGAILSTYQRTRIEHVCSRLNLTSLSYMWRMSSQRSLLDSILDDGEIEAILVRVACPPGLMPYRHLGKSLRDLRDKGVLDHLKDKWGMHPAGEGGEYETMVLDCPKLFKRGRLVMDETEIICDSNDDGVGILKIVNWRVEKKNDIDESTNNDANERTLICCQITERVQATNSSLPSTSDDGRAENATKCFLQSMHTPNVQMMRGGLCHISAILSPVSCNEETNEADAAVREFLAATQMLEHLLAKLFPGDVPKTSSHDILYVHLYLSEMSHFAKINQHYVQFFGTHLPPSRACVAVGKGALPGGRRVMMDCSLQRGSGGYLRSDGDSLDSDSYLNQAFQNKHHLLRKCLHVQSISHWAPVCIGPYSQANTLRSALVFLAGMIGLVPESMRFIEPTSSEVSSWEVQLCQSWKNAAAVLDGLDDGGRLMGGKLEDSLGALVYVSQTALESLLDVDDTDNYESVPWKRLWSRADIISRESLSCNGGIVMGSVDGSAPDAQPSDVDPSLYDEDGVLYGGYEDEGTWREMTGNTENTTVEESEQTLHVPLLMVCLPELPAKAQAEVELVCATRRAATCLEVCTGPIVTETTSEGYDVSSLHNLDMPWNAGYDGTPSRTVSTESNSNISMSSVSRSMGSGCASMSTVMASCTSCPDAMNLDTEQVLSQMIDLAIKTAKKRDEDQTLFSIKDILNVRLYYTAASVSKLGATKANVQYLDDGSHLRSQLHSVLKLKSTMYYHEKLGSSDASNIPAYTVVPVLGMHLSSGEEKPQVENEGTPLLAMQVFMCDVLRTEAELWIRYNR